MKITHLSTSNYGGAFSAAINIHQLCLKLGHDSVFYCKYSSTNNKYFDSGNILIQSKIKSVLFGLKVFLRNKLPAIISTFILARKSASLDKYAFYQFDECLKSGLNLNLVNDIDEVDILFVHWVTGFVNFYDIYNIWSKTNCRVIFTMMDMASITGGCHYSNECTNFHNSCSNCPALIGKINLAERQLVDKNRLSLIFKPELIAFSAQNYNDAKNSIVYFKSYYHLTLPYNNQIFVPISIPKPENKIFNILGSAFTKFNSRKGPSYFLETLIELDKLVSDNITIKVFEIDLDFKSKYKFKSIIFEKFEFFNDANDLSLFYSQMDLIVFTSIADAAPMMMAECLLCGIPIVSFDSGNARHIIENGVDGFVVPIYDSKSLAKAAFTALFSIPKTWASPSERHKRAANIHSNEKFELDFKKIIEST